MILLLRSMRRVPCDRSKSLKFGPVSLWIQRLLQSPMTNLILQALQASRMKSLA
ncbi:unnamed protein product [Nesidiocoris tenuis]|uniref:Uncharacterized protein n=1 Tax=Nesidiocoris tenuis TaxID=355587 RepID=A0A6H5G083_9HEMI|nr:unnamed protein product [Nesidiocoris tenuis]